MSNDYSIRPASPGDLDALLALEQSCFSGDRLSRRSFRRWLVGGHGILSVVDDVAGGLAGYVLLSLRRNSKTGRFYSLAVAPAYRGRGIARELLGSAERAGAARGLEAVRLEVDVNNTGAIRLYESLGYARVGSRPGYYENGADALLMKKRLAPAAQAAK